MSQWFKQDETRVWFVRFTETSLWMLVALSVTLLAGCSRAHVTVPTPPLPANLASLCQAVAPLPNPLIDPERLVWEIMLIAAYGDCAAKHRHMVEAWPKP